MYCSKCGFITKGNEANCPYCGTNFVNGRKLDQKIYFLNWFEITPRQILSIAAINLFILAIVIDIIILNTLGTSFHVTPWAFMAIFMPLYFLDVFAPKNNIRKFLFFKTLFLFSAFPPLLFISYGWDSTIFFNTNLVLLSFGFYYPILCVTLLSAGLLRFIFIKNFNSFSTILYVLISLFFVTGIFISTFVPSSVFSQGALIENPIYQLTINQQIQRAANICVDISFAICVLFFINTIIFIVLKLKSAFSIRS